MSLETARWGRPLPEIIGLCEAAGALTPGLPYYTPLGALLRSGSRRADGSLPLAHLCRNLAHRHMRPQILQRLRPDPRHAPQVVHRCKRLLRPLITDVLRLFRPDAR